MLDARGRPLSILKSILAFSIVAITLISIVNMVGLVVAVTGWGTTVFGTWMQVFGVLLGILLIFFLTEYALIGKDNSIDGGFVFGALLVVSILIALLAGHYIREAHFAGRVLAGFVPIVHFVLGVAALSS